jgi:cytochrome c oxidase subunit 3
MPGSTAVEELELTGVGGPGGPGAPGGDDSGGRGGPGQPAVPHRVYYTGLSLALLGILMFFMALVSAYIVRKGLGGDWQVVELPRILWLNTLVLVVSSATVETARRAVARGDGLAFLRWWGVTTLLGLGFLAGQVVAWRELAARGVFLASNPASSFFYLLTAAHGAHLLGGILALTYVLRRSRTGFRRVTPAVAAELAAIYWHFMDGLWVFLLLLLYFGR